MIYYKRKSPAQSWGEYYEGCTRLTQQKNIDVANQMRGGNRCVAVQIIRPDNVDEFSPEIQVLSVSQQRLI